ncbi:Alg9-like mannosyltransferase family-domain-containing protein [Cunninghamella echinulata]|nr:Alg9-like mannosyltransferase family-domain-containing protein [Cunninghamella echinulata]
MIFYLSIAGIIFRFECGILLVILIIYELIMNHQYRLSASNSNITIFTFKEMISTLFFSCLSSLLITILVDSWFWQTWLWPEGMVFYFNAILNKSSEWGTLPFYSYFFIFLPRLLMIAYPFVIWGFFTQPTIRRLLCPFIIYVLIFSCLPHKEWRFIVYTIPVFTAAASKKASDFILKRQRRQSPTTIVNQFKILMISMILLFGIIGSFMASLFSMYISSKNYPGGEALTALHQLADQHEKVYVHMDVKTAMTGASRFGERYSTWQYSKNESIQPILDDYLEQHRFTHIITSSPTLFTANPDYYKVINITHGLDRIDIKGPIKKMLDDLKHKRWLDFTKTLIQQPVVIHLPPTLYTLVLKDPPKSWVDFTLRKYPIILYCDTFSVECHHANQLLKKYCGSKDYRVIDLDSFFKDKKDREEIKQVLKEKASQVSTNFPLLFKQNNWVELNDFEKKYANGFDGC